MQRHIQISEVEDRRAVVLGVDRKKLMEILCDVAFSYAKSAKMSDLNVAIFIGAVFGGLDSVEHLFKFRDEETGVKQDKKKYGSTSNIQKILETTGQKAKHDKVSHPSPKQEPIFSENECKFIRKTPRRKEFSFSPSNELVKESLVRRASAYSRK